MQSITVYDASNNDRLSGRAWQQMFAELWAYKELIYRLVFRNIAGQFRQSFLSYFWIALPPLVTTLIFTLLRNAAVINVPQPENGIPYVLFVLVGTTLWQFLAQVTCMATSSLVSAGSLISKIYFPREVLIISSAGNALVNLMVRIIVIALVCLLTSYAVSFRTFSAILFLIPLMALGLGVSLLLAPFNAMMQDIGRLMEIAFQFGMFLAPTIYPTPSLSDVMASGSKGLVNWQLVLYWAHTINPVSHFIRAIESVMATGGCQWDTGLIVSTLFSFLVFLVGWRFFHICEPLLAERL